MLKERISLRCNFLFYGFYNLDYHFIVPINKDYHFLVSINKKTISIYVFILLMRVRVGKRSIQFY